MGLSSLAVILLGYYAKVKWPLPTGLMAVVVGMVLAWSSGLISHNASAWQSGLSSVGLHGPTLNLEALWANRAELMPWLGVIVPMGLFNVIGSLQNLERGGCGGSLRHPQLPADRWSGHPHRRGVGLLFPHHHLHRSSGFKDLGARSGYSWLNGVVMAAGCFFGLFGLIELLIPIDAGMAIVLYIGIAMTAQAFQASRHAPAVVLGILPGLAGWGAQLLKAGLRAGGLGTTGRPFSDAMVTQLAAGECMPVPLPWNRARSSQRCCWPRCWCLPLRVAFWPRRSAVAPQLFWPGSAS